MKRPDINLQLFLQKQADLELGRRIIPGSLLYLIPLSVILFITSIPSEWPVFVLFFAISNIVLSCIRFIWGIKRVAIYSVNPKLWKGSCYFLVLGLAALWGVACAMVLYKYGITENGLLMLIATESLALGGFATLTTHLNLLLLFQTLVMTPTAITAFLMNTTISIIIGSFIIVVQIFMWMQARTHYRVYWESITDNAMLGIQQKELEAAKSSVEHANQNLEVKIRERTSLLTKKTRQLDESYSLTIEALIRALDSREHDTRNHSLRVAFYTYEITKAAGIGGRELEEIALGALLHDIGKIGISDMILTKPGKLTNDEWSRMKKHPQIGWEIVKDIEFIGQGRELVLSHQERFDGSGYPRGLKGKEIYEGARFFAIIDTFDALTSNRPYRKAVSFKESADIIKRESGKTLDPEAADAFFTMPVKKWEGLCEIATQSSFHSLIEQIRKESRVELSQAESIS